MKHKEVIMFTKHTMTTNKEAQIAVVTKLLPMTTNILERFKSWSFRIPQNKRPFLSDDEVLILLLQDDELEFEDLGQLWRDFKYQLWDSWADDI